ncbi:MAG: molybdopterin molybdotransferase MoeA [Phycisphaerales bacterium]|nr:molybdopterin molybdotransferase MoeA [Phycisphaerales bacterium]
MAVSDLIDPAEGVRRVREHVAAGRTETVPLREALHRTLAEAIRCDVDYPPFDRALMDGFAVRAADVMGAPLSLRVAGQIAAGQEAPRELRASEAMQINTGAPIPRGADAVVRVEDTEAFRDSPIVRILKPVPKGHFITTKGAYIREGRESLRAGTLLGPLETAVAATCGAANVCVYARPRVGILVTGDELIDIDRKPSGAAIRNSNQYLLEALVREAHAEPVVLGAAHDRVDDLRAKVADALTRCDVLCMTGGVSMGAFDFVPGALAECGCTTRFHKVAIKPGRPTLFATSASGQPVFALPGNPISAFIGFHLFVSVALACLQGRADAERLRLRARLNGRLPATTDRCSFQPARLSVEEDGSLGAEALPWQGSGDPFGMAGAAGLIVRECRQPPAGQGAWVTVLPLPTLAG